MSSRIRFCLVALTVALTCMTAHAFAKRPVVLWSFFYFDGTNFVAGKPAPLTPFIAVRDGLIPVVETREERVLPVKLPEGAGALAGICYVQSYGGKLKPAGGYHAVPMQAIPILGGENPPATETDGNGFFVTTLPAGTYRVGREGIEVKIVSGTTRLLPLRVGKRMVD